MKERVRIPLPVVVEGKYDKMKLASIIDATIVTTAGFGIFNSREKMALIRRLADRGGVVILTDSDGAGSVIRSHIKSALPPDRIYDLYIPRIEGKERRKSAPSKDGSLGVEGMRDELLRDLFADFARRMGFDGLAARLGLPPKMTPNAFLGALNILVTRDELYEMLDTDE